MSRDPAAFVDNCDRVDIDLLIYSTFFLNALFKKSLILLLSRAIQRVERAQNGETKGILIVFPKIYPSSQMVCGFTFRIKIGMLFRPSSGCLQEPQTPIVEKPPSEHLVTELMVPSNEVEAQFLVIVAQRPRGFRGEKTPCLRRSQAFYNESCTHLCCAIRP